MKKILFAYNGSEGAKDALEELVAFELDTHCEVMVLDVLDVWMPPEPLSPARGVQEARKRVEQEIQLHGELVAQAALKLQRAHPDWVIQSVVSVGPPANVIVNTAKDWQADLILMGQPTRSVLKRFLAPRVVQQVLREASCSVEVARSNRAIPRTTSFASLQNVSPYRRQSNDFRTSPLHA